MNLTTEITITLKDAERTFKEKFVLYDKVMMTLDCPILQACVEKAKEGFKGNPTEILVKATASYE